MKKEKTKFILTIIGCVLVQLCVGILYLWSIFKDPVRDYYKWNDSAANMVASFMVMGFVLGNLIGGFLQDKTNPRLVAMLGAAMFSIGVFLTSFLTEKTIGLIYLTYCTLGGLGCGFTYGSVLSCLQKWMPKRRGLASGIAVASFGLSTVIFGPVSQILLGLDAFGREAVPRTFLTLSIIFFVVGVLACLLISLPESERKKKKQPAAAFSADGAAAEGEAELSGAVSLSKDLTPRQAMKLPAFWCIALTFFFINATWNIVLPMIKGLGQERGLSEVLAVATVTITGITNSAGRFSMSSISDKLGRYQTVILLAAVNIVCAIVMIFAKSYLYIIIIALIAFAYGGPSSTLPAMTTDLCGTKHGGTNYGIAMLGLGFSSIAFGALSSALKNATGSYTASFIVAACTSAISIGLMLLFRRLTKNNHRKDQVVSETDNADKEQATGQESAAV